MNENKEKGIFVSLTLACSVAAFISVGWWLGENFFSIFTTIIAPPETQFYWWKAPILICIAAAVGYFAENLSVKRILPLISACIAVLFGASILSTTFAGTDLLFLPITLVVFLTLLAVHLKKLWLIDSELTENLVSLASTGHLLEGKSADSRIESGLKLLETILPLSEAIVFRYEFNGELIPVGRSRNKKVSDSLASRQSEWLKNVGLCEQALKTRQTVVQRDQKDEGTAQVALPLICSEIPVGVLFVKIYRSFEKADKNLLEAFSGQLARNFQRKELREKNLPHHSWWSFLSTFSAENRLDITNLIHGIIKEQSFSAVASSYLKEAHAIAYLDGTLAYLNRQMRHLANIEAHQIYEHDLFSLLGQFRTEIFNEPAIAIRRVLQTGDSFKCELYFPETNKTLDMQISLVKVPSDEASIHETNIPMVPACFLLTFSDVTTEKENEKLRSDMASLMSHELRTPITSIQGFAEVLLMDETLPTETREFLEIIANESQRLSKMLTTFLSVSKLEQSDKQEVTKMPVKLDTVVREVVGEMQDTARRKRIRLIEQTSDYVPPIAADKGLIRRAVSNLIDNAIRYSPERTSVVISTILESDFLRVAVEDRGYGVPPSEHEKIWQKFYRVAREGQDKEEESTGLGLSLVKEIIEQHGGEVGIESEVGQGSKFSFTLPRL